jgi:Zn-dependent metalloprotease
MMKQWTQILTSAPLFLAALAGCSPDFQTAAGAPDPGGRSPLAHLEEELQSGDYGVAMSDLTVTRVETDDLAMTHTRVQQAFNGVPVFGGEAIVHMKGDGSLFAITNEIVPRISLAGALDPSLTPEDAVGAALAGVSCPSCLTAPPEVDLWVLRDNDNEEDRLAYRVRLRREDGSAETSMPVVFIDAGTGDHLWGFDNLQTATGASLYSGSVTIPTYSKKGKFYLEDPVGNIGTFDSRGLQYATYRFWDDDNVWDAPEQQAAVDVHYCASKFMEYFATAHNRSGIDGLGGPGFYKAADGMTAVITSKVHYGEEFSNAFWNGSFMTYGDGDGVTILPLVTLDICGHEMQHGITERTANLTYSGESGALNESWSDVFGALLERFVNGESAATWRVGEACFTPGNGQDEGIRDMAAPHDALDNGFTPDDDPDHYSERYTGQDDNGGVHINSGIANKAFHLLAAGGAHHLGGSMAGIGAEKAGAIWYKALTTFMVSSTKFKGARTATLNAADALYGAGSPEKAAVASAWSLVGVN